MWKEEDDGATTSSTGDDDGLAKKDLVDGLIAAVSLKESEHHAEHHEGLKLTSAAQA